MTKLVRDRDVVVLKKDATLTVRVDQNMVQNGWAGGQGVIWTDSPYDDFMVTYSDGRFGGFLLWGSNEPADQFISYTGQFPKYEYAVLAVGAWLISTRSFERYTYQSRVGGPPFVENTWTAGQRLQLSLRGLLTPQDEWTLSGDPRAPNTFSVAFVVQPPRPNNSHYLMVQTAM